MATSPKTKPVDSIRDMANLASKWAKSQSQVAAYTADTTKRLGEALKTSKEWKYTLDTKDIFKDSELSLTKFNKIFADAKREMVKTSGLDLIQGSLGSFGSLMKDMRTYRASVEDLSVKQAAELAAVREHIASSKKLQEDLLELEKKAKEELLDIEKQITDEQDKRKKDALFELEANQHAALAQLREQIEQTKREEERYTASIPQIKSLQALESAKATTIAAFGEAGVLLGRALKPAAELQFTAARDMAYLTGGAKAYASIVDETARVQANNPLLSDSDALKAIEAFRSKSRTFFPSGDQDILTASKLSLALNIGADASSEIAFNLKTLGVDKGFAKVANTMAAFAKYTDLTSGEVTNLVQGASSLMSALPARIQDRLVPQILAIGSAFKKIGLDGKEFLGTLEDMTNLFSDKGVLNAVFSTGNGMSFSDVLSGRNMTGATKNLARNANSQIQSLTAGGMTPAMAAQLTSEMMGISYEQAKRFGNMNRTQLARFEKDLDQSEELAKKSEALDKALDDQMGVPLETFKIWGTLFSNIFKEVGTTVLTYTAPIFDILSTLGKWIMKFPIITKSLGIVLGVTIGVLTLRAIPAFLHLAGALTSAAFGANGLSSKLGFGGFSGAGGLFGGGMGKIGTAAALAGGTALLLSLTGATDKLNEFKAGLGDTVQSMLSIGAGLLPFIPWVAKLLPAGVSSTLATAGSGLAAGAGTAARAGLMWANGLGGVSAGGVSTGSLVAGAAGTAAGLGLLGLLSKGIVDGMRLGFSNEDKLDSANDTGFQSVSNQAYRILNGASFGLMDKISGKSAAEEYQKQTDADVARRTAQTAARKGLGLGGIYGVDSSLASDNGMTQGYAENIAISEREKIGLDITRPETAQMDDAAKARADRQEDRREYRAHIQALKDSMDNPLLGTRRPNLDLVASSTFASRGVLA